MSRESRTSRRFYRVTSQHDLLNFLDRGETAAAENRWTFEIAWEAANKGYKTINALVIILIVQNRCENIFGVSNFFSVYCACILSQ